MKLYAVTLVTDLDEQVDLTIQASSSEEAEAIAFSMAELGEIGGIGGYPVVLLPIKFNNTSNIGNISNTSNICYRYYYIRN